MKNVITNLIGANAKLVLLVSGSLILMNCSNRLEANRGDLNSEANPLAKSAYVKQNALLQSLANNEVEQEEDAPIEDESTPDTPACLADVEPEMEISLSCADDFDGIEEGAEVKFDAVIAQFEKCLQESSVQIQTLLTQIQDKTKECLDGELGQLEEEIGDIESLNEELPDFDFKNLLDQLPSFKK